MKKQIIITLFVIIIIICGLSGCQDTKIKNNNETAGDNPSSEEPQGARLILTTSKTLLD
jgi:hypothetical protein